MNTFSKRIQQRLDNLKFLKKAEELSKTSTRDDSLDFFWRSAPDGVVEEIYFYPKRMTDLQKCLVDVFLDFCKGKNITQFGNVTYREIENFLRDTNDVLAYPEELAQEDLFNIWVAQLMYEVLISITQCSEKPLSWKDQTQVEKIKRAQKVLRELKGPKVELIDLQEEGIISIKWEFPVSAPIQNDMALFVREVLRKELGNPDLEILLET